MEESAPLAPSLLQKLVFTLRPSSLWLPCLQLGPCRGCTHWFGGLGSMSTRPVLGTCRPPSDQSQRQGEQQVDSWAVWWRHALPLSLVFSALRAQMTFSSCNYLRTVAPWCQFNVSIYFKNTQNRIFFYIKSSNGDNLASTLLHTYLFSLHLYVNIRRRWSWSNVLLWFV